MSWWGKLFGGTVGFMLGGPLGALIGAALGHNLDAKVEQIGGPEGLLGGQQRTQMAFFTATFSVMGHLAKADGRVSEDEIRMAQSVMDQMQLNPTLEKLAKKLYREGKQPGFSLDAVLDQFKRECRHRQTLIRMFLEILIQSAYADGAMHPEERRTLIYICERLGFTRGQFEHLDAMIRAARAQYAGGAPGKQTLGLAQAYEILGVSETASDAEVKKAYRRLMSQHHPDKLVAKGLPEEMMKLAEQKTHDIRQAYERIKSERGFK